MTIDVSIVRVALPTIQNQLDSSDVAQQWIVNAYLLTMGVFAIAGGRAGDRFGRRRVFLLGAAVFATGSALCGLSSSSGMLIATRAGQGVGAAIMTPGNIAMVTDAFPGRSLGKAMGVLVGVGSIGVSIGALLGGFLVEVVGWRSIFFVNVPVALLVTGLVLRFVPERRAERAPGLDIPGLLGLCAGMTALTLGLMQAPVWGFGSAATISALVASALILTAWLRIESRAPDPLVDPEVLRGAMVGANFVAFCVPFVLSGLAVLLAIYLQNVLGFSPLQTGLLMLPLTVPGLVGSLLAGWLMARLGARVLVTGGMVAAALGIFLVGAGADSDDYVALAPGLVLFAFGAAIALPPMTATIMASAGALRRGMVSGVYGTARLVGSTLGLAAMGALLATFESSKLDDELRNGQLDSVEATHVHNLLAGGESGRHGLDGLSSHAVGEVEAGVRAVFDSAFATTLKLSALVAAAGALVAFKVIPRLRASAREEAVEGPLHPGG